MAIVGDNRPRLYWTMTAVQAIGAVPVPLYQDSVAEEMAYVLEHAEVRFAVVEDQEQVDKLLEVAALPGAGADRLRRIARPARLRPPVPAPLDAVQAEGRDYNQVDRTRARDRQGNGLRPRRSSSTPPAPPASRRA
jgi:long-chain acyl-CoA synthetase